MHFTENEDVAASAVSGGRGTVHREVWMHHGHLQYALITARSSNIIREIGYYTLNFINIVST